MDNRNRNEQKKDELARFRARSSFLHSASVDSCHLSRRFRRAKMPVPVLPSPVVPPVLFKVVLFTLTLIWPGPYVAVLLL